MQKFHSFEKGTVEIKNIVPLEKEQQNTQICCSFEEGTTEIEMLFL